MAECDATLARRLAAVGIIAERDAADAATLGGFLEGYFERAVMASESTTRKANQNPKQSVHVSACNESHDENTTSQQGPKLPVLASIRDTMPTGRVGGTRLELVTSAV